MRDHRRRWAFAHGFALLEIDRRPQSLGALDRTWRAGADAFEHPKSDAVA